MQEDTTEQDERQKILEMVAAGKLTAAEAMELLAALGETEPAPAAGLVLTGDVIPAGEPPPDMHRFRRFWQIPFFISLTILLLLGLWLRSLYQASAGALSFGFICLWSVFMFAFAATIVAFMSRRSSWLHVRIKEKSGRRINISLPLPTRIAQWGLNIAANFVDDSTRQTIDMAAAFLDETAANLRGEGSTPFVINVDDEDGDQVQVFIG